MAPSLFQTTRQIILASASPRRQKFLSQLGLEFTTVPASIDETPFREELAVDFVQRMATNKAYSVAKLHPHAFVIGADTIISFQGAILGKPKDTADALQILQRLQGATHEVITSLSLYSCRAELSATVLRSTKVTFGTFPNEVLAAYIQTGEPMDKAGAYGIQGAGGFLIHTIEGSCSNVIGLPMNDLVQLLRTHKVITP